MSELESPQSKSLLPFRQPEKSELKLHAQSGKESYVYTLGVEDNDGKKIQIALKENKKAELASIEEMAKLKEFYEFLKNDLRLGKFVIESGFVKAQKSKDEPAKAFIVQKFIPGKRIEEIPDRDLYQDKELVLELLEFVDACVEMLKESGGEPRKIPDLYSDKRQILGNLLHDPRYTGNIVITGKEANLPQRVHFVDAGSLSGPGKEYGPMKKFLYPIDLKLQLLQLLKWKKKLESALKQNPAT